MKFLFLSLLLLAALLTGCAGGTDFADDADIAIIGGADGPTAILVSDGGLGIVAIVSLLVVGAVAVVFLIVKRRK